MNAIERAPDESNSLKRIFEGLEEADLALIWNNNFEFRKELPKQVEERLANYYIDVPSKEHKGVNTRVSVLNILIQCGCIQPKNITTNMVEFNYDYRYVDVIMNLNAFTTVNVDDEQTYMRVLGLIEEIEHPESPFSKAKGQVERRRILNIQMSLQTIRKIAKDLGIDESNIFNELSPLFIASILFIYNIGPDYVDESENGFVNIVRNNRLEISTEFVNNIKLALVKIADKYRQAFSKLDVELSLAIEHREDDSNSIFKLLKLKVLCSILEIAIERQGIDLISNKAILKGIEFELGFCKNLGPHASLNMEKYARDVINEIELLILKLKQPPFIQEESIPAVPAKPDVVTLGDLRQAADQVTDRTENLPMSA